MNDESIFPPALSADNDADDGLVGYSQGLDWRMLADAYRHGIFPWPWDDSGLIPWAAPRRRGVLKLSEVHLAERLRRDLKKMTFTFAVDRDFSGVIRGCAAAERPGQEGTWITPEIIAAYEEFHRRGYAHSFEARTAAGELAGGLYGVSVGRIFCGESMFYRVSGASKFAFVRMTEYLRRLGVVWLDTQMVTGATAYFGAREIPSAEYLEILREYGGEPLVFPPVP